MKTAPALLLALLVACGDAPEPSAPEPTGSSASAAHAADPHAGLNLTDPHAGLGTAPAEPFRVQGRLVLPGDAEVPEQAVFFLTVRGAASANGPGPMWLTKRIPVRDAELHDGERVAAFTLTEGDTMQPGLPRPEGQLFLHAKYHPSGYVEDPDVVVAPPLAVTDGMSGFQIEFALP